MIARSKPMGRRPMKRARPTLVPDSIREAVLTRAGHKCERCESSRNLELHHQLKRSQGGKHVVSNLVCLCRACHQFCEEHPAEAVREGWSVQKGKVAL